jgi:cyclic beta-1,2-glucan synthetase
VTEAGTGGAWLGPCALTRWRGDRTEDPDGWFVYLRDGEGAFWSAGLRPVQGAPERYEVEHGPGWVATTRVERGIEARMEAWVDPEDALEFRLVTLRNRSGRARAIEITTRVEVALDDAAAFEAHPAFSRLFLETEAIPGAGILLAHRRPRDPRATRPWLGHALFGPGALEHETDRGRFLGRGRDATRPRALTASAPLSGTAGRVLDPVLCLRRRIRLEEDAEAQFVLLLAAAEEREGVVALLERRGGPEDARTSLAAAETAARARFRRHGVSAEQALDLERLGAALWYGDPRLAPPPGGVSRSPAPPRATDGPAPGVPRVLVLGAGRGPLWERAQVATAYWRDLGFESALIGPAARGGAGSPRAGRRRAASRPAAGVQAEALEGAALAAARVLVLRDRWPLAGGGAPGYAVTGAGEAPVPAATADPGPSLEPAADLAADNGRGGFTRDGREYVIRLSPDAEGLPERPPMPWVNVIANPRFGTIVSESGASSTWSGNSREHRLTPWSNDPVLDPHDEALYLKDEESGAYWSPLPGPRPGAGPYETRHGLGWSRFRHASGGLEVDTLVFVPPRARFKLARVKVTNRSGRARRIALTSYARLVLGDDASSPRAIETSFDRQSRSLLARRLSAGRPVQAVAFAMALGAAGEARFTCDRASFLGSGGSPRAPAALEEARALDGRTGAGLDPCFALEASFPMAAGGEREILFVLGEADSLRGVGAIARSLRRPGAAVRLEEETRAFWEERLGRLRIETPLAAIDPLVNGWLPYQALACRLWGRSAFYQSGGALGFRDQLQDALAFLPVDPPLVRAQILLHAAHQFAEGDVLHWWHPPRDRGLRTRFADDRLWLPYAAAQYVAGTGDEAVLEERVPFLRARALEPGEDEAYLAPRRTGESSVLYEHCCRALDASLAVGAHGLPLFGCGDWNDGMNRVGREGRGESVWMAFFLCAVLDGFLPHVRRRGDPRAARYERHRADLARAIEDAGWDGEWYRRGYYDDGAPLGSRASDECRIDALVQAWSVISNVAPRERAEQAMDAVERLLVSEADGIVRLLDPPFDRTPHDPGYIKGYLPGVRENGGQYTHAALWVVRALAELGRTDRAARLLEMLSPISHARDPAGVARYQVEPYVVAADVYGAAPHVGRGGWTWYTGSAGWMMRVTIESLLGVRIEAGKTLVVRPAIPFDWPGYRLEMRPLGGAARYDVRVDRGGPGGVVREARLDGLDLPVEAGEARIPLSTDGGTHRVDVRLAL